MPNAVTLGTTNHGEITGMTSGRLPHMTGYGTVVASAFGKARLDDVDAASARVALGTPVAMSSGWSGSTPLHATSLLSPCVFGEDAHDIVQGAVINGVRKDYCRRCGLRRAVVIMDEARQQELNQRRVRELTEAFKANQYGTISGQTLHDLVYRSREQQPRVPSLPGRQPTPAEQRQIADLFRELEESAHRGRESVVTVPPQPAAVIAPILPAEPEQSVETPRGHKRVVRL